MGVEEFVKDCMKAGFDREEAIIAYYNLLGYLLRQRNRCPLTPESKARWCWLCSRYEYCIEKEDEDI
jgi:hypothetical protein